MDSDEKSSEEGEKECVCEDSDHDEEFREEQDLNEFMNQINSERNNANVMTHQIVSVNKADQEVEI